MAEESKLEINVPRDLRTVYLVVLGLSFVLFLLGFGSREYGYLISACFLGIVSRIIQAEHHHRELQKRAG